MRNAFVILTVFLFSFSAEGYATSISKQELLAMKDRAETYPLSAQHQNFLDRHGDNIVFSREDDSMEQALSLLLITMKEGLPRDRYLLHLLSTYIAPVLFPNAKDGNFNIEKKAIIDVPKSVSYNIYHSKQTIPAQIMDAYINKIKDLMSKTYQLAVESSPNSSKADYLNTINALFSNVFKGFNFPPLQVELYSVTLLDVLPEDQRHPNITVEIGKLGNIPAGHVEAILDKVVGLVIKQELTQPEAQTLTAQLAALGVKVHYASSAGVKEIVEAQRNILTVPATEMTLFLDEQGMNLTEKPREYIKALLTVKKFQDNDANLADLETVLVGDVKGEQGRIDLFNLVTYIDGLPFLDGTYKNDDVLGAIKTKLDELTPVPEPNTLSEKDKDHLRAIINRFKGTANTEDHVNQLHAAVDNLPTNLTKVEDAKQIVGFMKRFEADVKGSGANLTVGNDINALTQKNMRRILKKIIASIPSSAGEDVLSWFTDPSVVLTVAGAPAIDPNRNVLTDEDREMLRAIVKEGASGLSDESILSQLLSVIDGLSTDLTDISNAQQIVAVIKKFEADVKGSDLNQSVDSELSQLSQQHMRRILIKIKASLPQEDVLLWFTDENVVLGSVLIAPVQQQQNRPAANQTGQTALTDAELKAKFAQTLQDISDAEYKHEEATAAFKEAMEGVAVIDNEAYSDVLAQDTNGNDVTISSMAKEAIDNFAKGGKEYIGQLQIVIDNLRQVPGFEKENYAFGWGAAGVPLSKANGTPDLPSAAKRARELIEGTAVGDHLNKVMDNHVIYATIRKQAGLEKAFFGILFGRQKGN